MAVDAADGATLPGIVADERTTQLAFLRYLRAAVDATLEGVSEADARRSLVASRTTLLGVAKHLTTVERYWGQRRLVGADVVDDDDGFTLTPGDTVDSVRRNYAEAAARTDENVEACDDLDRPLARSSRGLTLRWMLAHMVEETARHAGHADILRELIDGRSRR